jgi:hypothetical protein
MIIVGNLGTKPAYCGGFVSPPVTIEISCTHAALDFDKARPNARHVPLIVDVLRASAAPD